VKPSAGIPALAYSPRKLSKQPEPSQHASRVSAKPFGYPDPMDMIGALIRSLNAENDSPTKICNPDR
jgi:hypothetical protein